MKSFKKYFLRVSTYTAHNNVNFKIVNSSHLSPNLGGVIGRFLPPQAYEVTSASPHPQNGDEGTLLFRGEEVDVVFQVVKLLKTNMLLRTGCSKTFELKLNIF